MSDFAKQLTDAVRYLSDRSSLKHYTKILPDGVELPDALRGWLYKKDKKWLRKLYCEGYMKLEANKVWEEMQVMEYEIFQKLLRLFFPEPINLEKVYKLLREWNPDREPVDLIMLGRRVIEQKDEVLKYDEFYEDYMELRSWRSASKDELKQIADKLLSAGVCWSDFYIEPNGAYVEKVIPHPYFHYIPILLHAHIVYILREWFYAEERAKQMFRRRKRT